jgi:hypothetical protein
MQIILDKKKKTVVSVITAVVFVAILFIVVFSRNETSNNVTKQTISNPVFNEITITRQKSVQPSEVSEVKDFIFEKSLGLIISLSKSNDDYTTDLVFQNLKSDLVNSTQTDISSLGLNIRVKTLKTIINSDGLSGVIYVKATGDKQKSINFSLTYAKNSNGVWKLVGYSRIKPSNFPAENT